MGTKLAKLPVTIDRSKHDSQVINIQITKDDFENFCNICGLYRKDFLDTLDASELDHQQGRITERDSLYELIKK
ncbi:hypothetical protein KAW65_04270 [candidate division WOR-3 bacterium]|nr:hypothetical protein [candidate division WOR-3 bacterium]